MHCWVTCARWFHLGSSLYLLYQGVSAWSEMSLCAGTSRLWSFRRKNLAIEIQFFLTALANENSVPSLALETNWNWIDLSRAAANLHLLEGSLEDVLWVIEICCWYRRILHHLSHCSSLSDHLRLILFTVPLILFKTLLGELSMPLHLNFCLLTKNCNCVYRMFLDQSRPITGTCLVFWFFNYSSICATNRVNSKPNPVLYIHNSVAWMRII